MGTTTIEPTQAKSNADRPKLDDSRNGSMTNAERQRRYRDRKRGGPPRGRWAGHLPAFLLAKSQGTSRSYMYYASWILDHASDVADAIEAGDGNLAVAYERLRREYESGLMKSLRSRPSDDARLFCRRENGEFVFEWIEDDE